MKLNNLFKPINLGKLEIRNRIVLAPMGIGAYNEDETVAEDYISFIKARVEETGLVVTTGVRVSAKYGKSKFMGCFADHQITGLRKLSEAAHRRGAKIFLQILELGGADLLSPYVPSSNVPLYNEEWKGENRPKELTNLQIKEIIEDFIQAAGRAQESGFDGVELGGAENFLISDFLCPCMNSRMDEYGGGFENRMRFPTEVVKGIKEVCGKDFPVGFKFNAFYDLPDGIDLKLGIKIAKRMVSEGVAYIHEWSFAKLDRPMSLFRYPPMPNLYQPRNTTVPIAQELKNHITDVPIIAVGGIVKPDEADRIIGDGKADMVAIGRGFIADHRWAYKAKRGEVLRPCIRCHVCHHEVAVLGRIIACSVNPDVLMKEEPEKTDNPRDVMVAGAGPGGIMAALTAASRGHRVSLYEKGLDIGGMLIPGSAPDFKHEFGDLLQYLRYMVKKSNIDLKTRVTVTPELIRKKPPDILIVATGAEPKVPAISGVKGKNIIYAVDALNNAKIYRNKSIAVVGGGDVGCETALLLSRKGNDVSLIEIKPELMETEEIKNNTMVLEKMLREAGVNIYTGTVITEISQKSVKIKDQDKNIKKIPADIIVIAAGFNPTHEKVEELMEACGIAYSLGDCLEPKRLRHAISEGYRIGSMI